VVARIDTPGFIRGSATLSRAFEVAAAAHRGQSDREGTGPYLSHPVRVAETLHGLGVGETPIAAALLHDVVEKTSVGEEDVKREFGPEVGALVGALTDDPRIADWSARKAALRAQVEAAGPDAVAIYVADKLANLREMRRLYEERGEAAIDLHKAPSLDARVEAWRADAAMARAAAPQLSLRSELVAELDGFEAQRRSRAAAARVLSS
jgi:(p)ppGpp synthase/HD superfamily hydrolase